MTAEISFPLPTFTDVLDTMGVHQPSRFILINMRYTYSQFKMHPKSIDKTTFVMKRGAYRAKRMPFWLQGSATMQRLMTGVLRELIFENTLVYIDDMLEYSNDFQCHLRDLQMIFDRLRSANLKLHPLHCNFAMQKWNYLGFHFSCKGCHLIQRRRKP